MAVGQAQAALELQASEAAVVQAASRILAALIRNGRHTEANHTALLRFAVRTAWELAQEADRVLRSDGETARPAAADGPALAPEAKAGNGAGSGSSFGDDILDLLD